MMVEVKVDPGAQVNCIPLHKFRTLFPHLYRNDKPKEGVLDPIGNEPELHSSNDLVSYGHLTMAMKH